MKNLKFAALLFLVAALLFVASALFQIGDKHTLRLICYVALAVVYLVLAIVFFIKPKAKAA